MVSIPPIKMGGLRDGLILHVYSCFTHIYKDSLNFSNFRLLENAIAQVKVLKQIRPIAPRGTLSGIPGSWVLIPQW